MVGINQDIGLCLLGSVGTAPPQSRGLGCACDGTLPGWFSSHLNTCLSGAGFGTGARGGAATPCQLEPAGVGRRKTVISCSLRGSSPLSLIRKMVSIMFTSQVGVPPEKRSVAGVCARAHPRVPIRVLLSISKSDRKAHAAVQVGDAAMAPFGRGHSVPHALLPRRALL